MDFKEVKQFHAKYYSELVSKHGDSLSSVGQSAKSQKKRFEKILEIGDLNNKTILDVGCGLGSFYEFLKSKNIDAEYTGYDITDEMIKKAKESHSEISDRFEGVDIMTEDVNERFDYVISVGALNLPLQNDNFKIMIPFIKRMYEICNNGIAISMTSAFTKKPNNDTYYYEPFEIVRKIGSLCQNLKLDHTYLPHDFTLFCYKRDLYS